MENDPPKKGGGRSSRLLWASFYGKLDGGVQKQIDCAQTKCVQICIIFQSCLEFDDFRV